MRVLMLDQTGQMGGAEFAMLELCERAGFDWSAVLFSDGPFREKLAALGRPVQVLASSDVNEIRKDSGIKSIFRTLFGVVGLVRRVAEKAKSFDVIYANTQKSMVIGALAGLLSGRPVVWYLHDIMTPAHFGRAQLTIVRWMVRHFLTEVVCNSQASRDSLAALTGLRVGSFKVVYNGIASDPFDRVEADDRAALRARFGLPSEAFLVGCFSRLAHWKGQHVLLQAIASDARMHAVLVGGPLFGAHAYERELRQQVDTLGIADRVHFLGFQSDIPALMCAMDVVAHTSVAPEPFGRVIVEGMLAGRPVVVSNAGGVGEIVEQMKSGLLVEPGHADDLHHALTLLHDDTVLSQRLASEGCIRARSLFTPMEHCRKMTDVLFKYRRDKKELTVQEPLTERREWERPGVLQSAVEQLGGKK